MSAGPTQTTEGGAPAPSRHTIVVIDGPITSRVPLASDRALVIGRAPECDVVLRDARCSRFHARLDATGRAPVIVDLGSHNGTRVNGRPVGAEPVVVRLGDTIELANAILILHGDDAAPWVLADGDGERGVAAELERALAGGGRATLVALRVEGGEVDPRELADALRPGDVVARASDGLWLALLPELAPQASEQVVSRLVAALAGRGLRARAGVALAPDDGARGEVVVAAAAAAADAAELGQARAARDACVAWSSGGVTHVVADPVMIHTLAHVRRLAAARMPVLIVGETGVGKEGIARLVHEASPRAAGPFVAFNCAAMPGDLVESELFGHDRGAFTGAVRAKPGLIEIADRGTLFLDEIGELSSRAQAALLRVLETGRLRRVGEVQERPVDFRVVAATHRDLDARVAEGLFRSDLLFRLAGAMVYLPPLRERPRDLPALARHLLAGATANPPALAPATLVALARHTWPGNVRELKFAIDYAVAQCDGGTITPEHLPARVRATGGPPPAPSAPPAPRPAAPEPVAAAASAPTRTARRPLAEELDALEARRIREALATSGGNRTEAARLLGMPRRTFFARLKALGITGPG